MSAGTKSSSSSNNKKKTKICGKLKKKKWHVATTSPDGCSPSSYEIVPMAVVGSLQLTSLSLSLSLCHFKHYKSPTPYQITELPPLWKVWFLQWVPSSFRNSLTGLLTSLSLSLLFFFFFFFFFFWTPSRALCEHCMSKWGVGMAPPSPPPPPSSCQEHQSLSVSVCTQREAHQGRHAGRCVGFGGFRV